MKEAALRTQHDLMVKRNTELHNLDQMCKAATDRITELTHLQRDGRNTRVYGDTPLPWNIPGDDRRKP